MADKTITGTSLEVLAPYLPYKLEMAWVEAPYDMLGQGYYLRSLSDFEGCEVAISHRAAPESFDWWSYKNVLPVLRPFSQLVEPLPDGTVPAVEVAKLMGLRRGVGKVQLEAEYIVVQADGDPRLAPCYVIERRRFEEDTYGGKIRKLLLSYHFAVGLEQSQFIAKQ